MVAAACDVSKKTMDAFRDEARLRGVQEWYLWTKAHLEDMLFQPRHDHLLFAYFNVSLTTRRRSHLASIRQQLSVKRKLFRALADKDEHEPMRQRIDKPVLIRDAADNAYPKDEDVQGFSGLAAPPWHLTRVIGFYSCGLVVTHESYVGWVRTDGTWDVTDNGPNAMPLWLADEVVSRSYQRAKRQARHEQVSQQREPLRGMMPEEEQAEIRVLRFLAYENILSTCS